jgi:two-component system KDP operon response regulator KdpE
VDDEPQLIRSVSPALTTEGYEVSVATTGREALDHLARQSCDAVLLDLGLPDMDGKAVIEALRRRSTVPVLVLSARDAPRERIASLDLGADDYISKPFDIGELLARIRAATRSKDRRPDRPNHYKAAGLEVDFSRRRARLRGEEVQLTRREHDLLCFFATHAGEVLSHHQIMASVRGQDAPLDPQFVRVLVAQLRRKLETDPSSPRLLLTEPGVGYRLATEIDPP